MVGEGPWYPGIDVALGSEASSNTSGYTATLVVSVPDAKKETRRSPIIFPNQIVVQQGYKSKYR